MENHTGGSWEISVSTTKPGQLEVRTKKVVVAYVAAGDPAHTSGQPIQWEEAMANALLISAAPNLLAACKAILAKAADGGNAWLSQRLLDALRSAIAKAEGR